MARSASVLRVVPSSVREPAYKRIGNKMELLLILAFVLFICFVVCALVGFISVLKKLFGGPEPETTTPRSLGQQRLSPEQDAVAAGRLVDYLATQKKITSKDHELIRRKLANEFPTVFPEQRRSESRADDGPEIERSSNVVSDLADSGPGLSPKRLDSGSTGAGPGLSPNRLGAESGNREHSSEAERFHEPDRPSSIAPTRPPTRGPRTQKELAEIVERGKQHARENTANSINDPVDPFDVPDEISPTPKRSLNEVLAGFMEKKNIRWGELASGILIVGSVVGLVVSLKDDLRDKIPYFSALVFMLVTAAIHGSGIYTLRKWNLRTTSRGVLLIGLLLVPLNFLAACVLNGAPEDRRAITDPLYWMAILIGLAAYSAMSFFSSRDLLRRRFVPITITVLVAGISILVANRFDQFYTSIAITIGLTAPAMAAYLFSSNQVGPHQWTKHYISHRFRDRALSVNGLGLFSIGCLLAFLLIRSGTKLQTVLALAPALSVVAISFICLGDLFYRQSKTIDTSDANPNLTRSTLLIGRSINVFGWGSLFAAAILSMTHPTIALINAAVTLTVIVFQLSKRNVFGLINGAWIALSAAAVMGLAAFSGSLSLEQWPTISEIGSTISRSNTGVALVGVGLLAGIAQYMGLSKLITSSKTGQPAIAGTVNATMTNVAATNQWAERETKLGKMFAATLLLLGLGIVLVASLIHRNQPWDCGLASCLLGAFAIGSLGLSAIPSPRRIRRHRNTLEGGAILLTVAFLAHGFFWNPVWGSWLQEKVSIGAFDPRLLIAATAATGLFAASGLVQTVLRNRIAVNEKAAMVQTSTSSDAKPSSFQLATYLSAFLAIAACFFVAAIQSGLVLVLIGFIAVALLAVSWKSDTEELTSMLPLWLLLCVSAVIANIAIRYGVAETLSNGNHFVLQVSVAGILLALVAALKCFLPYQLISPWLPARKSANSSVRLSGKPSASSQSSMKTKTPGYEVALLVGIAWLFVLAIGFTIVDLGGSELSANWKTIHAEAFSPNGHGVKLSIAAGVLLASSAFVYILRPSVEVFSAMVATGVLAVAVFAANFHDSKSVATVTRWLVPLGTAAIAFAIGIRKPIAAPFAKLRNSLKLPGRSFFAATKTQTVINGLLSVAVIVVLGISTITVCQLLLDGKEALGGPIDGSYFGNMRKDVSFGGPVGILVGVFLWFAITERRSILAMCGSAVFQYVVLMAVTLLFISPHPKLASDWFVNIMQAISLGMTGYGVAWWWYRSRIGETKWNLFGNRIEFLNAHTAINGVLIGSLVVLILQRYWMHPAAGGGWITSAGGWLGILAAISMFVFAWTVWNKKAWRYLSWYTLAGGLTASAFVAAAVDKSQTQQLGTPIPWSSFRVIFAGTLVTVTALLIQNIFALKKAKPHISIRKLVSANQSRGVRIAIGMAIAISFFYCMRGAIYDPTGYWIYLIGSAVLLFATTCYTYYFRSSFAGIPALILVFAFAHQIMTHPILAGWESNEILAALTGCCLWAVAWLGLDRLSVKFNQPMSRGFFILPNLVIFLAALSLLVICGILAVTNFWQTEVIGNVHLMLAVAAVGGAWVCNFWSRHGKVLVSTGFLWAIAIGFFSLSQIPSVYEMRDEFRITCLSTCLTVPTLLAAIGWLNVDQVERLGTRLSVARVSRTKQAMRFRIPIWIYALGGIVIAAALNTTLLFEFREARMWMSFLGLGIAISFIVLSMKEPRYHIQVAAIGTMIVSFIIIGWANIGPSQLRSQPLDAALLALVVPAVAVFVFGVFATRWIRSNDSWIEPIRDATVGLTIISLIGFGLFLMMQFQAFDHDLGSGISVAKAGGVTLIFAGVVIALITIAVLPYRDPLSMSLTGRQSYVYIAQLVLIMTAAHVYLSMPWLLKTGILKFWPYLAMFVSFSGILMSQLLRKRKLEVLSEPIFNTAALIPVLVSIGFWMVDSRADAALTFLLSGLIYLGIAMLTRSIFAGILALLMGNVALWIFYKDMSMSFSDHPQLWLIPPAISVLIASHLERRRFTASQLAVIRYACVFVIYLSSTTEIFIRGIGDQLWPPMVLAILSLAGMAAGILLQVRSFLFVGSAFLLMSMIAMVSLAQNRFEHVWPWWAFGICLGAAILVAFGVFEKRRNDLIQIGKGMRKWDL